MTLATLFQSTHPSGVRPQRVAAVAAQVEISIHAPQWGATHVRAGLAHRLNISIHAPQWGATINSVDIPRIMVISIHAPQWGATISNGVNTANANVFQSTHPSGVRRRRYDTRQHSTDFNPRTPVGCDQRDTEIAIPKATFNPRTPVGCDGRRVYPSRQEHISIHAPQWGATC